ncbi:MAG TPA: NADH-quinone oxidoreductase subunit N [Desulfobacterales bacterium]
MNWMHFAPELFAFGATVVLLMLAVLPKISARGFFGAALAMAALGLLVSLAAVRAEGLLFAGTYRVDLYSQVFKVMLFMGLFLVICLCGNLAGVADRRHAEFYLLMMTATLAMMLLVSSVHLLTVYVALELSSYSLYVLVSLRRERAVAVEAGIKYFLVGVSASAVMLLGIALLYGSIQAMYLETIAAVLPEVIDNPIVLVGLMLTLGGFFFKLAVFPFHFWAPDVYQGAANEAAAFIATASKVGAVAILVRIVSLSGGGSAYLVDALVVMAVLSMTVGNLVAIVQKDFKRMLAYSSIAHAGYVLVGILSMNSTGYAAAMFYALSILLMKFTVFLVLATVADDGRNLQISELAGLHRNSPLLAMALMLSLFGLAGIPPTIGFTAKLLVFTAAMKQGLFLLVLIAMINVVISLYYYIMAVKAAYLMEPASPTPSLIVPAPLKLLTIALVLVMVAAGMYPTGLFDLALAATESLF